MLCALRVVSARASRRRCQNTTSPRRAVSAEFLFSRASDKVTHLQAVCGRIAPLSLSITSLVAFPFRRPCANATDSAFGADLSAPDGGSIVGHTFTPDDV